MPIQAFCVHASAAEQAQLEQVARQGKTPPSRPAGAGPTPCSILGSVGRISFDGFGMPQVANMLIGQAGRIVVDRTGLSGNWQFVLTFAPEGGYGTLRGNSIFTHGIEIGIARNDVAILGTLANCSWSVLELRGARWRLNGYNAGTLPDPVVIGDDQ